MGVEGFVIMQPCLELWLDLCCNLSELEVSFVSVFLMVCEKFDEINKSAFIKLMGKDGKHASNEAFHSF